MGAVQISRVYHRNIYETYFIIIYAVMMLKSPCEVKNPTILGKHQCNCPNGRP